MRLTHQRTNIWSSREARLLFEDPPIEPESQAEGEQHEEPEPESPAGRAWAKLREEKKALSARLAEEEQARMKAEARVSAFEEIKQHLAGTKPSTKQEQPDDNSPEATDQEAAIVISALKKKGIDVSALLQSQQQMQSEIQRSQLRQSLTEACSDLEKKFSGSVPFDRDEVIRYAQENGYGVTMAGADIKRVLELAHREKNYDKFVDLEASKRLPKKLAPDLPNSKKSSAPSLKSDPLPDSPAGFAELGKKLLQEE